MSLDSIMSLLGKSYDELDAEGSHLAVSELSPIVVGWDEAVVDPRLTRMSYSSSQDFAYCPRKYQLKKLAAQQSKRSEQDWKKSITFAFGHFLGEAVQDHLMGMSYQEIVFKQFSKWPEDLFMENEKQHKSFFHALHGLDIFIAMCEDGFLKDYEVAMFNGKPAAELSFKLVYPNGFTYRGFVDLILRHKYSGEYVILENKTSSANYVNYVNYKNSEQALGYSIVLDQIAPGAANYTVEYLVYLTKLRRWENFAYPKTYVQRALWIRDRIWNSEVIENIVATEGNHGIWPMQSIGCITYGSPCEFMDSCQMSTEALVQPLRESDLEEDKEYDFVVNLEDLL